MENTNTSNSQAQNQPDMSLGKYFSRITELPLNKFIECQVDGNLAALIISGFPTPEQLAGAWQNIMLEYADAVGDSETRIYYSLWNDVEFLHRKFEKVQTIVSLLEKIYSKFFADELNKLIEGSFKFNWENQDEYRNELQRCLNRSKSIKVQYDLKKASLKAIEEKQKDGIRPTREYYQSILLTLSDHAQYKIKMTEETVFEFCERLKRYNAFVSRSNAK